MRMKKILFIIMILLFIIGMRHTVIKESDTNNNSQPQTPAEQQPSEAPAQRTLTVTAVGDFTLATDVNTAGSGSFVSEVQNQNNDYTYFLKNVSEYFNSDDLTIINFEGTLSENGSRADKQFAFRGDPEYVKILTSSSIEAANLANNHTLDYGQVAYDDTVGILSENNITNFGGTSTAVMNINDITVGLIGTNALNSTQKENFEQAMTDLVSSSPDMIIASFHWGIEKDNYPTEEQIELAHKAIDMGADLVIGHHPHVLQGVEKYNGKYILYSLGNFCFGGNKNPSDKDTVIFKQTFTFNGSELASDNNVSLIPCLISSVSSRNNYQPTPASGDSYDRIKNKIVEFSEAIEGNTAVLNFD